MIGAHGVYSVQDFWSVGAEREVRQGKNVADAALGAAIEHLVFSSVGGAERGSRVDHFETKAVIQRYIRAAPTSDDSALVGIILTRAARGKRGHRHGPSLRLRPLGH